MAKSFNFVVNTQGKCCASQVSLFEASAWWGWGLGVGSTYMGYVSKERDRTARWSGGFGGVQSALTVPAAKGR